MAFTNEQLERYFRHIILKEVGVKGQKKLLNAKVLSSEPADLEHRQPFTLQQQVWEPSES